MTEPLKVDTDELDAASAILKSAAGQIPTQLPQFSVNGSDPLSAAIAAGSAQMEAPMAALPWIQANATTTAENIGVAGKRYRETDETLAQKAKEHQFDKNAQEIDGSAQEIKGLSHSQAAIEQLTRTMTEGGIPKPPDIHSGPGVGDGAGGRGAPEKFDWSPDGKDWTFIGAGAVVDGTTDAVRKAAVTAMKEGPTSGPGKASPGLVKFLDDVKIAGKTLRGVSGAGGLMSAVMVIPNVLADMGEDGLRKAIGKNAGGAAAGVGAAALFGAGLFSVVPGVGTVIGLGAGAVAGYLATEYLDTEWESLADRVGSAVQGLQSATSAVQDFAGGAMRGVASVFSFG
jgi:hypothetical protein